MSYTETPQFIPCGGERLLGILALPAAPADIGIVIVVGGPQTRVGSHRQFVLLSRCLAASGYAVLRFDYRGMGDSSGEPRGFEQVDEDIGAALDALQKAAPSARRVVLWGLCDAASAALLYWQHTRDGRIAGFCLANPWVRSAATLARTQVRHYYGQRLFAAEFWRKLVRGQVGVGRAVGGFVRSLRLSGKSPAGGRGAPSFRERMLETLKEFPAPVLLILSGQDFVAREFLETSRTEPEWSAALAKPNLVRYDLPEADHTFSSARWRADIERATLNWLHQIVR